jgi:lipopolysaccharide/colanic/teichoic acid biosynthesis glycosyltransferase
VPTQSMEKTSISELERTLNSIIIEDTLPAIPSTSVMPHVETLWDENASLPDNKPVQWFMKRTMDLVCSGLGLLALAPFLAIVALAIRLESPGPIIYKQKRVGFKGRLFDMYKFRSMSQNADAMLEQLLEQNETNNGMFKLFDDPRVTRVGKFIRKYSIDELPQLFNVLKGDMSLVGPRPPIDRELKFYQSWHYLRFTTLPGLTGIWQVSGRSRIKEFDTVVKMDFRYIKEWNILLDIKLILKTLPVVFGGMDTA